MKSKIMRRAGSLCLALALMAGMAVLAGAAGVQAKAEKASVLPVKQEAKTGVTVYSNAKASVDASNLGEGYLIVQYTGGKNVRIKVRITKSGTALNYDYDLNNLGNAESFPLTEGDGKYQVTVFENTTGTKYANAFSCEVDLKLRNDFLPYLYSNQYVNYTAESQTVKTAATLCADQDDRGKVEKVFDYVVDNFTYDDLLAATVQGGYLPDVDKVLAAKKGICFDYSAVMTAMLRSQNVPCKLVVGYAGDIYHAWINVYIEGEGWVDKVIYFDGNTWTLMDPTFTSSGKRSESIMKYVTDESHYTQKYAY